MNLFYSTLKLYTSLAGLLFYMKQFSFGGIILYISGIFCNNDLIIIYIYLHFCLWGTIAATIFASVIKSQTQLLRHISISTFPKQCNNHFQKLSVVNKCQKTSTDCCFMLDLFRRVKQRQLRNKNIQQVPKCLIKLKL